MEKSKNIIGIFDSGVGGLSVFREIYRLLPCERYVYFSDNAHCPYGEKTREYIIGRAKSITEELVRRGASVIVLACNTATSAAIATLRKEYDLDSAGNCEAGKRLLALSGGRIDHIKFIGMEPAVKPAALVSRTKVVGVLATAGTLKGEKYLNARDMYSGSVRIVEHVGQGFVELVERGELEGANASDVVRRSVVPLLEAGADNIVLGCTHYPFLAPVIARVCREFVDGGNHPFLVPGSPVGIIDPAPAVARHLVDVMRGEGLAITECAAAEMSSGIAAADIELIASGPETPLLKAYGLL